MDGTGLFLFFLIAVLLYVLLNDHDDNDPFCAP